MASFQKGDIVTATWKGGMTRYPGRISEVNSDGSFQVAYDDGDFDEQVPAKELARVVGVQLADMFSLDDDDDLLDMSFMDNTAPYLQVYRKQAILGEIRKGVEEAEKIEGKKRRRKSLVLNILPPHGGQKQTLTPLIVQGLSPAMPPPQDAPARLLAATSANDLFGVWAALSEGVEPAVDSVDGWQRSPLMVAARRGNPDTLATLLVRGYDPAQRSRFGHTPLTWAAYHALEKESGKRSPGHLQVVRMLLTDPRTHGEAVEGVNALGETVLHTAVRSGDAELVRLLVAFEAVSKHTKNLQGKTAKQLATDAATLAAMDTPTPKNLPAPAAEDVLLHDAAVSNDLLAVMQIKRHKNDLYLSEVVQAAHAAAENNAVDVLGYLLRDGDVRATSCATGGGPNLLMRAAITGNRDVFLIVLVADRTGEAQKGTTANNETLLHCAARGGSPDIARLVLLLAADRKAALGKENNQGQTASQVAASPKVLAALSDTNVFAHKEAGLATPSPFQSPGRPACAVCLLPPPNAEDVPAHVCECQACFCDECFVHLCQSSINEGTYPTCCNNECNVEIAMESLRRHLPINQLLLVASIAVNKHITVDSVYAQNCSVCNRTNDMRDALATDTPRKACDHCGVFTCVVCRNVHPFSPEVSEAARRRNVMDAAIHARCYTRFTLLKMYGDFSHLLETKSQRFCPMCGVGGIKNDSCTHMSSCCGKYWCYVCGVTDSELQRVGTTVGNHGAYGDEWLTDPSYCMMYLHHMARVDARVAAIGCPDKDCRPHGSCSVSTCANLRDQMAGALLATMRVRYHILQFARKQGKRQFEDMLTMFGVKEQIDRLYFDSRFPWEGDSLPTWDSFEPEEMRAFYRHRQTWLSPDPEDVLDVHPDDVPTVPGPPAPAPSDGAAAAMPTQENASGEGAPAEAVGAAPAVAVAEHADDGGAVAEQERVATADGAVSRPFPAAGGSGDGEEGGGRGPAVRRSRRLSEPTFQSRGRDRECMVM